MSTWAMNLNAPSKFHNFHKVIQLALECLPDPAMRSFKEHARKEIPYRRRIEMVVPFQGLDDVTKKGHLLMGIPRRHKAVGPKELIIAALPIR